MCAGSLCAVTGMPRPSTSMEEALAVTGTPRGPCVESNLSRWARVAASARSLIATTSMPMGSARRSTALPILPNPLMPILMVILLSSGCAAIVCIGTKRL